jgi:uncharacterized protein (TIGR01777 family)
MIPIMRIVVSGSSGLIGRALVADLSSRGHQVVRLVRRQPEPADESVASWDPAAGHLSPADLEGADAVINLNGRNIGQGRWTSQVKEELRSSRLRPARLLTETIAGLEQPPAVVINASAVGYYGDRGDEILNESSSPGKGFLARLTQQWEEAATAARSTRTRVVLLRLGMVLGRGGGALASMLPAFRLGLGGPIGDGRQWWPWVAMEDVVGAVLFALERAEVGGAVNVVSPQQVRCSEFVRTLGQVLHRPAFMPLPRFAARMMLGEMADALLLASARVRPATLETLGYEFARPELEGALRQALD